MSDEIEFWPERGETLPQFCLLAALHSELIAVSANGQLFQWKWNEAEPYRHPEVSLFCIKLNQLKRIRKLFYINTLSAATVL